MRLASGAALVGLLVAVTVVVAEQAPAFHAVSITKVSSAPCPPAVPCQNAAAPSTSQTGAGPDLSTPPSSVSVLPGGRFEARNQTIENLARVAFGFEQVDPAVGVVAESKFSNPGADRFDITAVADREWPRAPAGEKVPSEFREMLRGLLEERFKLQAHVELTSVEVLALQLVRVDRERGPGLRRSTSGCVGRSPETRHGDTPSKCHVRIDASHIEVGGVTMSELAAMIYGADGARVDRFIVDQTGLSGRYDVVLSLESQEEDQRAALRDALKTQLGLKLVKTKVPLPTLIIDHAEAPL